MIALTARTLLTPLERINRPILFIEDSVIAEVTTQESREIPKGCRVLHYADAIIAPGLIDIHVHGGAGFDVMDNSPTALQSIEQSMAKHGVTTYFPTTVTAPMDVTLAALDRLAEAIEKPAESSARLRSKPAGIHLEGPFISHARRGVHPAEDLLPPSVGVFNKFWEASRGHIRVMTIAPELDGALEVIREAGSRGVVVSLGHTDATAEITRQAIEAGARHATHLFNGMRPMTHRDPGIVGEALANAQLAVEIIADGIHLDPSIVKLVLSAKEKENIILVTDGTAGTGMPDGQYHLGTFKFEVKDGKCLADGHLAGSLLTMDRAIRNVMDFAQLDLQQAVIPATVNPGRATGKAHSGELKAGTAADIVVFSPTGEIRRTIIAGVGL